MHILQRPRAYCTFCHAAYRSGGGVWHRTLGRYSCPGIIRIAPNASSWRICGWCNATGGCGQQACTNCNGDGWVLAGSPEALRSVASFLARPAI